VCSLVARACAPVWWGVWGARGDRGDVYGSKHAIGGLIAMGEIRGGLV
jgi:hypothetical protein